MNFKRKLFGLFGIAGISFLSLAGSTLTETGSIGQPNEQVQDSTFVWDLYEKLGKIRLHKPDPSVAEASVERGKDLVEKGYAVNAQGKRTGVLSKYFKCTDCHYQGRESADWSKTDADSRLSYSTLFQTPMLPGTTFYGLVNRESFFNGDYQTRYADGSPSVAIARTDVRKAIEFCALRFAQGRPLQAWETESILRYFWSLQLKIGDLEISDEEYEKINMAFKDGTSSARAIHLLKAKFPDKLAASFAEPPRYGTWSDNRLRDKASFEQGKTVYEQGCRSCHAGQKSARTRLDYNSATFQKLSKQLRENDKGSVYHIVRTGSPADKTNRPLMPAYTLERLSAGQLEDLRLYIEAMARNLTIE